MTTGPSIASQRLVNQLIDGSQLASAAEVVRRLGAVQAQDFAGALWAVGLRTREARAVDVLEALREGAIVRTWPLRGTLHFAAPADVRGMLGLSRERQITRSALRNRQLGLDSEAFAASRKLLAKALRGGKRLTRAEAYALLDSRGVSTAGQRGIHIIWRMAQEGLLCYGPPRGAEQTFVLLDEWVPPSPAISREEARAALALRYFESHGPSTLADFTWWSGLAAAECRAALEDVRSLLAREAAAGIECWGPRDGQEAGAAKRPAPRVVLLPPFDEYLVGYKDRTAAVGPEHVRKIANMLSPTIVSRGRVVGTWTRTLKKGTVAFNLKPFSSFAATDARALQAALARYARFLERDVVARASAASGR